MEMRQLSGNSDCYVHNSQRAPPRACSDLDVPQLLPMRFHPSYVQKMSTLVCVAKLGEEAHAADAASKGRSQRRWPRHAKMLLGEVEAQPSCRYE